MAPRKNSGTVLLAPAKINLFLHVGPLLDDGYHAVCSLMEKVSLYDRLIVRQSSTPGVRLAGMDLPPGSNLVEMAARLFSGTPFAEGIAFDVELHKEIPVAAGLAGGSSDAAAFLGFLAARARAASSSESKTALDAALGRIAGELGADVPFFFKEGPCLAEGAGGILTPVELPVDYRVVIVTPETGLSTAEVYRLYDEMCPAGARTFERKCRASKDALGAVKDLEGLAAMLHNDLEIPAASLCAEITQIKDELIGAGAAGAIMSGSGPSVFGLFAGEKEAEAAIVRLSPAYPRIWSVTTLRN